VYAKLIENWLTNVNELGYQAPFCEVLLSLGYSVIYISSHGPGEHGKDVIARDSSGALWTFQLKGGPIRLSDWRRIQDEVRELVELPVNFPGLDPNQPHHPVLVTNGAITPDARDNIKAYAEKWHRSGAPLLDVWSGTQLLKMFVDAHGSYLPSNVHDFRRLLELYSLEPHDRLPREKFAFFVESITTQALVGTKASQRKRAMRSMVLLGSYVVSQYETVGNHIAAAEGWTLLAMAILRLAERDGVARRDYEPSLSLARLALDRNLEQLEDEVVSRANFIEPKVILAEPIILGTRTAITLGWLAARAIQLNADAGVPISPTLTDVFWRELSHLKVSGEADWPYLMTVVMFLERTTTIGGANYLLLQWIVWVISANGGDEPTGVPSPYWLQDKVLRYDLGLLAPYELESFVGHSYTLLLALDMLVRRGARDEISAVWAAASKVTFCNFLPDAAADFFRWRTQKGELQLIQWPQPVSWTEWRTEATSSPILRLPQTLLRHSEWLLPCLLTMPHRLNRESAFLADSHHLSFTPEQAGGQ
jgi:hypothetical protein